MQTVFDGLVAGSVVALLATAFQLVYLPTRVFFLTVGGLYALAPYITQALLERHLAWPVALVATGAVVAGLSCLCELANHAPLRRRQASSAAQLIAALGVYIVLVQAIAMIWGSDVRTLRAEFGSVIELGEITIADGQVVAVVTAIVFMSGLALMLSYSAIGLRLRAMAENSRQFALLGYNVERHRMAAFGLCGLFATAASLVSAYDVGFDPYNGLNAVLLAAVAVIVGGRDSFAGPALGALALGLLRAEVVWHSSARWQEPATFLLLALFLLFRPAGLVNRRTRLEATP